MPLLSIRLMDTQRSYWRIKRGETKIPEIDIVVGNIATGDAARMLVEAGADGEVWYYYYWSGSICTLVLWQE